ncbi:MAG: hypothetical protein UR39_C0017G0007 [Candidatus Woesebacteria bacterium GW2011_GWA1_33_30]|uniref:Uncharacterized protein n=1 Tax=Candidatus Woesebacteria bacterium GW2011_GWA2_33_28 TaxID=1618561 RepID=A0A0G0C412_9BACT|nr:MAG: hypothetical protein UR38_C0015G0007 [Candidatus Woesebacteria bacterium GW2011_GWA2_33_28]KKP46341.1 MAG: hypothetical protein UR39_C0017G0007 [Candidatus Woesebacteria bacterium GW2011_GWA1_33_30]KKP47836.1 MAG: hypothetical protein UR40_C0017G0007 [Microgenomates group bacterium GW2011_GWC1_33_32]KKP51274.1 MAG: hypothetical protein UR44_C0014G0007 [Candidatus Woesebacteria bacterium GW2011_GWB1_33_38]
MKLLAQSNPFGTVDLPQGLDKFGSEPGLAFGKLIQFALRGLIVVAGLYALFNLVLAGYAFMSAGDDAKKVASAWAQIYQTIIGLAVAAGSFVLAALFGQLLFDNPLFLLQPTIPIP